MKRLFSLFVLTLVATISIDASAQSADDFRVEAEQGVAEAQYNLGVCYYNGDGVDQNYTEAVKWLSKAADQGHDKAQTELRLLGETW